MSNISEELLDALIKLPNVQSLWLKPNNRRGSHFSRADEDLILYAPAIGEAEWQKVMSLVSEHEGWFLITVIKVMTVPVEGATQARPHSR